MSFLSRLTRSRSDNAADMRALWHRVVEIAREKAWYQEGQVADTVTGRFDVITMVLTVVLLRMEREDVLHAPSTRLTELFVTDMDGQLRQGGVGDLMVGKHVAKLMSTLGGRIGALRDALAHSGTSKRDALAHSGTSKRDALAHSGTSKRDALALSDDTALAAAIERNVTLVDGGDPWPMAALLRGLVRDLDGADAAALLAGRIAR